MAGLDSLNFTSAPDADDQAAGLEFEAFIAALDEDGAATEVLSTAHTSSVADGGGWRVAGTR